MKLPQFLMFIPFLKKLMVETSAEAVHKACKTLEVNGIPYRIQTYRMRGIIGTGLESSSYMRFKRLPEQVGFAAINFLWNIRPPNGL